jgi:uncharacterized membrane protein YeaQ/YmgE (transglycosylase-associated protein family)
MSIIAWIVLGLIAGLIANMLIPGRRQQGLILTCVIGIVGALLGGWVATKLFHIHSVQGFFNLSTWITAIVGAAILLLAYHLISSQPDRRGDGQRDDPAAWSLPENGTAGHGQVDNPLAGHCEIVIKCQHLIIGSRQCDQRHLRSVQVDLRVAAGARDVIRLPGQQ